MTRSSERPDELVAALRSAGCVFAEEEAAILRESAGSAAELGRWVSARVDGTPLEHLVGWVGFRDQRLCVGPGVFVPRQRTRLLADIAVDAVEAAGECPPQASAPPVFVEAFAGVAPIAAMVRAECSRADIHVTDIDEEALRYARTNVADPVGIHVGPVLAGLPDRLRRRAAVIAAVPPYVPIGDAELLPREARDFEPSIALLGGEDGLDAARELIRQASLWIAPSGRLLLELHSAQCAEAARSGRRSGFTTAQHLAEDGQTAVLDLRAP